MSDLDPTIAATIERCWRNGLGLTQTAHAIKRDHQRKIDPDTIQRAFARLGS